MESIIMYSLPAADHNGFVQAFDAQKFDAEPFDIISSNTRISCTQKAVVVVLAGKLNIIANICYVLHKCYFLYKKVDFLQKIASAVAGFISWTSLFYTLLEEGFNRMQLCPHTFLLYEKAAIIFPA